jgi:transcriptional antiterminator RfaH
MQSLQNLDTTARWYLLQSKPRQEARALENLERQGFQCRLPLYSKERIRKGRRALFQEPLFPRYLFVRLDDTHSNWYVLRSTLGVSGLVRFGEHPATLGDDLVEGLFAAPPQVSAFERGAALRITQGPFVGLEALFDQPDGDARAFILLDFMAKQQRISLPLAEIAAA